MEGCARVGGGFRARRAGSAKHICCAALVTEVCQRKTWKKPRFPLAGSTSRDSFWVLLAALLTTYARRVVIVLSNRRVRMGRWA
jgi:hypothetical protein